MRRQLFTPPTHRILAVASNTFKALLPLLLVCSSLAVAVVLFITRPEPVTVVPPERAALVDVAEVVLQDLRIPIQAQGTVTPHRETTLGSEVEGKILSVSPSFHVGGFIAKGREFIFISPWAALWPSIAIGTLVVGLNLFADGLREETMRYR